MSNTDMNSTQFLEQEAARAKLAMVRTLVEMREGLGQTLDARSWIREFPWLSLGAGSVLGFFGGAGLTPAANEPWRDKWSDLAARADRLARKAGQAAAAASHSQNGTRKKSLLSLLAGLIFKGLVRAMV